MSCTELYGVSIKSIGYGGALLRSASDAGREKQRCGATRSSTLPVPLMLGASLAVGLP